MAIPNHRGDREYQKFLESTSTANQLGVVVINPDGSDISGGSGGGGDGAILDGVTSSIKASVFDLSNSNPIASAIVDGNGDQITSFGGGTQYTDGDAQATPVGTVAMGTDGSNIFALSTDASGNLNVIGTFFQATQPVSGTFWQATQPVSGTFFQATQPVSAVSLPLPAGAATSALQQTDGLTDTELRATAVPISGTVTANGTQTDALTDTELRATAVPISAASLPLPSGAATSANQLSDGHDIIIKENADWISIRANYTAAQTNTAIITTAAKLCIKKITITADNANTVDVQARVGFATATTPTTTDVLLSHPGIAAGSGIVEFYGSDGITGTTGEDLRITSEVPTTGSIDVVVVYKVI